MRHNTDGTKNYRKSRSTLILFNFNKAQFMVTEDFLNFY